jgi:hypothetical protein
MSISARLSRRLLPAAPVGLAALSSAHAQIVYTNADDLTFQAGGAAVFFIGSSAGPDQVTYVASGNNRKLSGYSFYIGFQSNDSARPYVWTPGYHGVSGSEQVLTNSANPDPNSLATVITAGTVISGTPPAGSIWGTNLYSFLHNETDPGTEQWTPGTTGYLALKLNDGADYGWVQVTYNANQTLTIVDFAYNSSGGSIQAGDTGLSAVPEPANYALIAGLLAGSVALYRRRQQANAA